VIYLGEYGSDESREKYDALIARWLHQKRITCRDCPNLTIRKLAAAYMNHARTYYRKGGVETTEVKCICLALKMLLKRFGGQPAADFDALKLEDVRDRMVAVGWVRGSINRHVGRIRRMFRWGVKRKLVPRDVYVDVCTLDPLLEERSEARESTPVEPVPDLRVDAALPYLSRPVRGLVEFMRATGARPGEALIVRGCDLTTTGDVWEYRPSRHKTQHHKRRKSRVVMIGPAGKAVLKPFLRTDQQAYLFDPRDALQDAAQRHRDGAKVRTAAGEHYTLHSLASAIRRACEIAFDMPERLRRPGAWIGRQKGLTEEQLAGLREQLREESRRWRKEHSWHANQLRHAFGTKARQAAGIEGSRVVLGHASAVTSEIYAERDMDAARQVVARIG
jgi:integrase